MTLRACSKCNQLKTLELFSLRNKAKEVRHTQCKQCIKVHTEAHYKDNKGLYKSRAKSWTESHIEERKAIMRDSYAKIKGYPSCKCCLKEEIDGFLKNCPEGYEVDHIDSVRHGGSHCLHNMQYLTVLEHSRKSGHGY